MYLFYNLFAQNGAPEIGLPVESTSGVSTIWLLRENTDQDVRQYQMDQVLKNPVLVSATLAPNCSALGPFASVTSAQAALERVESMDYLVTLRAVD